MCRSIATPAQLNVVLPIAASMYRSLFQMESEQYTAFYENRSITQILCVEQNPFAIRDH